jgi:poly(hydroxyalkanoate) granule-associated protein
MASRKKSRKTSKTSKTSKKNAVLTQERMLEALHQVWLAGLGAVSKAQKGAPKLLDELIVEGGRFHTRTRNSAQKAIRGVLEDVQTSISARVGSVREQASDTFDNLEKIFQTRVHRALNQLGVPSAEAVEALSKRVDALNANIEKLAHAPKTAARKPRVNGVRRATPASASLT